MYICILYIHTFLNTIYNKMSLSINEDKTKYLVISKCVINKSNHKVESYYFEQVDDFKYLVANIINA